MKYLWILFTILLAASGATIIYLSHSNLPSLKSPQGNFSDGGLLTDQERDFLLEPAEIHIQEREALAGDTQAAARLANHYMVKGEPEEERKWLAVIARSGDCRVIDRLIAEDNSEGMKKHWRILQKKYSCTFDKTFGSIGNGN